MKTHHLTVNPATYQPLLQLIATVESSNNYNAYFGHPDNTSIDFTAMTLAQVMQWQDNYRHQGSPTLVSLVHQLDIDTSQKFDQKLQDQLAIALLERRGSVDYVNNKLTPHDFAANLAKEWAALPKVIGDNPDASYYAADGLNKSLVGVHEVLEAIKPISSQ